MTEEEYVAAYKDLPGLNEAYIRARYKAVKGEARYDEVLKAYNTTQAHKQEVQCKPRTQPNHKTSNA